MSVTRNYGVYYAPAQNANESAKLVTYPYDSVSNIGVSYDGSGNLLIDHQYGTDFWSSVTINKPTTLIPANIRKDITIGNVTGTLVEGIIPAGNITLTGLGPFNVEQYATASVQAGSISFTSEDYNPPADKMTISVSPAGLIQSTVNTGYQTLTPTFSAGWISTSPSATYRVRGSKQYQLPIVSASTYTPTTTDQIIPGEKWITSDITILGDEDLISRNIAQGVTIFGVTGILTGVSQVSTLADMDSVLVAGHAGMFYLYTGETGISSRGNLYTYGNMYCYVESE